MSHDIRTPMNAIIGMSTIGQLKQGDAKSVQKADFGSCRILMDIRMPVMNGLEATQSIRALDRADAGRTPILAMTANAFEEDKIIAWKAGMTGYLVKPLDIQAVLDEIKKYI